MIDYTAVAVTCFMENCILLWNRENRKGVAVDPGGDFQVIRKNIQSRGIELQAVLLTHGHLDHIGAVRECAEFFHIPVIGPSEADQFWLQSTRRQSLMLNLPEVPPLQPEKYLADGEIINFDGLSIQALHTPGHTPGHMCYYIRETELCLTGDLIFCGSVGRTDFPGGDLDDLLKSIREKIMVLPDNTVLLPGHGPATTVAGERESNPFI